jgi:hypothetical protein
VAVDLRQRLDDAYRAGIEVESVPAQAGELAPAQAGVRGGEDERAVARLDGTDQAGISSGAKKCISV